MDELEEKYRRETILHAGAKHMHLFNDAQFMGKKLPDMDLEELRSICAFMIAHPDQAALVFGTGKRNEAEKRLYLLAGLAAK